ncbi:hypothetical protein NQZ68_035195 [Dissostichus eleginoides]|nr:hypothetical protein NQZ68_035195 [Dissostichus eleginoides]
MFVIQRKRSVDALTKPRLTNRDACEEILREEAHSPPSVPEEGALGSGGRVAVVEPQQEEAWRAVTCLMTLPCNSIWACLRDMRL